MALGGALKDTGRIVRKEAQAKRVEGRTRFVPVARPDFKCRLTIKRVPQTKDEAGVMSFTSTPLLLCGKRDKERNDLLFEVDDFVEVTSRDMPQFDGVYQVDGLPEPIRKKKRVIGWQLTLSATSESDFSRAVG